MLGRGRLRVPSFGYGIPIWVHHGLHLGVIGERKNSGIVTPKKRERAPCVCEEERVRVKGF